MNRYDNINLLSRDVIGAAIEVHRAVGCGLLESAYQIALAEELRFRGIPFEQQVAVQMIYGSAMLDCAYRMDFLVAGKLIVEIKSVAELTPIHSAQLLTYMQLTGKQLGLLLNSNTLLLTKGGIRRVCLPGFEHRL